MVPRMIWLPANKMGFYHGDDSIVNTIHTDHINPADGAVTLKPAAVVRACNPKTKHLILNRQQVRV